MRSADWDGRGARTDMKLTMLVAGLLLSLAACGPPPGALTTASSSTGDPGPSTVVVSPKDAGKTVPVHVGDRVLLATGPASGGARWVLADYPADMLSPAAKSTERGEYRFEVIARGLGRLILKRQFFCGGIRPAAASIPCPVGAESGANGDIPSLPIRPLFVITLSAH